MQKKFFKKTFVNEGIRAREIRVIDESGNQMGVMGLQDALKMAKERNLDLVQVTEKVFPPVCKITDYGKYLYQQKKREKAGRSKVAGEVKGIRLGFGISLHDLGTRVMQAEKFLKKGYKIRVEMRLRGRERSHSDFGKAKIESFLNALSQKIPIKIEKPLGRELRGLSMIVSRGISQEPKQNTPPEK